MHNHTLQMLDPEIAIEFDSDPKQARASRQDALKDAATRKIWIAGAHIPFPGIGHIRAESNGSYTWVPVEYTPIEIDGNVLIIGFGRMGQVVSQMPLAYGATISILDNDPDTINVAREYGFKVYYGDATRADVLHASGVEHTDIVAVCVDNGESAVRIVENIHHINPNAKVFVRAWDRRNALALVKAEADFVVRETFYSSMKMGDEIVKALGASVQELRAVHDKVRDADKERFALEIAGKEFEGRRLLLGNIKKNS